MQSREEPLQLKLDTSKSIFFKPTQVGCSSTSLFTFRNPSRLPVEFEWRVSQQYRKLLTAQPTRGLIQPNETLVSSLTHCPRPEERVPTTLTSTIISYSCLSGTRLTMCTPHLIHSHLLLNPQSPPPALQVDVVVTIIITSHFIKKN